MKPDFPFRAKAGMYTLVAVALLTGLIALKYEGTQYSVRSAESEIGFFDHRFEGLRKSLPASGVAGYLSDQTFGDTQSVGEFLLAQYSLAPVVIVNNTNQSLVVGNFHTPNLDPAMYASRGLVPVVNLGNGAWLFRRAGK
jgi:hypothetical protein